MYNLVTAINNLDVFELIGAPLLGQTGPVRWQVLRIPKHLLLDDLDEQSWVRLRDLRGGWLDHPQADPNGWLGFHARAQDASPEAAADANRRRRPGSPHASPQTDDI